MVSHSSNTVVYTTDQETQAAIKRDGLAFFEGAREARGHPGERRYAYGPWQQTPLPSDEAADYLVAGAEGIDARLRQRISDAARLPGGFYTATSDGSLAVLPDIGVIVFSYND